MAANPYTLPAKYEYKPLPLDFMLQAGLAQEGRRAKTEADLYELQQQSMIPHGYSTVDVAKAFESKYSPEISTLSDAASNGDITSSEAIARMNNLKARMQKDSLFQAAKIDASLNPIAMQLAVNPAIKQEAAQKAIDPATGRFNQVDPNKVISGEFQMSPNYYSMLERPDFKASYDPIMDLNSVVPPKVTGGKAGQPYIVQLPYTDPTTGETKYTTQTVQDENTVKEITSGYFRDQISGFVGSNQYLNNPYNDYFKEKYGRDMTQDEMYNLAEANYSPGFFSNTTTETKTRNVPAGSKDPNGSGKDKDVQGLFDNVATTNLNFGKVNPLSEVKTYQDLVNISTPKEGVLDAVMQQHNAVADGSDENGMIYKNAKTGLPFTEAESVALESDLHRQTNKINGAQNIMAQLQPEIDKIKGSISDNEFELMVAYNKIDKTPVVGITSGPTSAMGRDKNEWENLQMEVDAMNKAGESVTKQADGNYYKVGGNGNLQLPKEIGEKLYAVQSWETRGPALEKQAKLIDKKLNDLVAKSVASFDVAGKAFLFNDDPTSKDLYNPTHKKIAQDINSAMGTFPDTEVNTEELWGTESTPGKFRNGEFNPKMFFMKDNHWMARGAFEKTIDGNKVVSKDTDITIDEIIKKDLPTNGDFQLQVYSEIDDQMNYILPGNEGKVTIFGKSRGKQDDVTMKVYKSATGESVRVESDNALFTLGDIDPKTGEFKYRPHYVKSQEFNSKAEATLDVVKSQAALQEHFAQYPYTKDANGNFIGDVKYSDSRQNKEAVEQSGKVLKEQLGWSDDIFNGFMKAVEFETAGTFDPGIRNEKHSAKATGLIQFYPDNSSAPYDEMYKVINGTKYMLKDIQNMSVHQQMSGPVFDYFAENGTNIENPEDAYLAIFYPGVLKNPKYSSKSRQARLDTKLTDVIDNVGKVKEDNQGFSEAETVGDLLKIVGIIE